MTDQTPQQPVLDLAAAERAQRRADRAVWSLEHLRICWVVLVAVGALLDGIGAISSGGRAAAGAALGTVIVGVFFTLSAVIIAAVGTRNPKRVMVAALATYLLKIVVLGVVLVLLPRNGPFDTKWMAGAVAVGVFAWLGAHMRYIWTAKILYVDPAPSVPRV